MLVKHIEPRLGSLPVGEINPEIVADFRAKLEAAGVGRHSVRQSLAVLQAMYEQAIRWGWVATNPVKAVEKPAAKRERAVVCLAPSQVEAIRAELLARDKLYTATMVSIVAYQGLRAPEELLALEVRHVRRNTPLVEQRNIDGKIIADRRCVASTHARSTSSIQCAATCVNTCSLTESAKGCSSRRDGEPWRLHDYQNWRRRTWHSARARAGIESLRPLTCGTLSPRFRFRAGMSIPELAQQMGHSAQMTVGTYTHVIRELKGQPIMAAEDQIEQARREDGARLVDVDAV
jgi:integrase